MVLLGPRVYLAALGNGLFCFLPLFLDFLPLPAAGGPDGPAMI
jgi:hypothetical protein